MIRADLVEGVWVALDRVHDMDVTLDDYTEAVVAWLEQAKALRADVPADAELDDLQQELRSGVVGCGMHDDNSTELFDVEGAGDTMFVASDAITALRQQLAAAQAERTECCLQSLASMGQAAEAYAAQLKAEAERDALRAHVSALLELHIAHHNNPTHAAARAHLNTGEPQ